MEARNEDSLRNENESVSKDIWTASKNGLLNEVQYWLKQNPEFLFIGHCLDYETPLYIAAENGHFKIVHYLVTERNALSAKNCSLWKPLKWTFFNKSNDLYCLQNKLQTRSAMYYKSYEKDTIFQMPLLAAALIGNLKIVKYLLANGYKINDYGIKNKTALHFASKRGHLDMVSYLLKNGANVNCEDIEEKTPLFDAIDRENSTIKYLIDSGANANHFDKYNYTPFHYAAFDYNFEKVRVLLENGALVYINDCAKKYFNAEIAIQDYLSAHSPSSSSEFDIVDSEGEINPGFER